MIPKARKIKNLEMTSFGMRVSLTDVIVFVLSFSSIVFSLLFQEVAYSEDGKTGKDVTYIRLFENILLELGLSLKCVL